MENVKILVVEDQSFVSHYIAMQLEKLGYNVIGTLTKGEDVLPFLKKQQPDLIIMDINLAGSLSGIETANIVNHLYEIPFLYLTNLRDDETFKKALSTRPAAYLNKPFEAFELSRNIELALFTAAEHQQQENPEIDPKEAAKDDTSNFFLNKYLFIKDDFRYYKVEMEEILWVEADSSYSTVKTLEKEFVISKNLRMVNNELDKTYFMQVHKSYIINVKKIKGFEGTMVIIDNKKIPIGKTYQKKFKDMIRTL